MGVSSPLACRHSWCLDELPVDYGDEIPGWRLSLRGDQAGELGIKSLIPGYHLE